MNMDDLFALSDDYPQHQSNSGSSNNDDFAKWYDQDQISPPLPPSDSLCEYIVIGGVTILLFFIFLTTGLEAASRQSFSELRGPVPRVACWILIMIGWMPLNVGMIPLMALWTIIYTLFTTFRRSRGERYSVREALRGAANEYLGAYRKWERACCWLCGGGRTRTVDAYTIEDVVEDTASVSTVATKLPSYAEALCSVHLALPPPAYRP